MQSASALGNIVHEVCVWERERKKERERETYGRGVTIVALKLAMRLHFPLPKTDWHVSLLLLHFSLLPSRMVTLVALKFAMFTFPLPKRGAQWPIGYGVGLRIKRSSVRIRPWPLRWVLGQGSLLPLSQGEAFTLASISYLAILVKYILAKKKALSLLWLS